MGLACTLSRVQDSTHRFARVAAARLFGLAHRGLALVEIGVPCASWCCAN